MSDDVEYLKRVMKDPHWWTSHDTVMTVGDILAHLGILGNAKEALAYVEKPWKAEPLIKELL